MKLTNQMFLLDVVEPQCEDLLCRLRGFENLDRDDRVVVQAVCNNFQQQDFEAIGVKGWIQSSHSKLDNRWHDVINSAFAIV